MLPEERQNMIVQIVNEAGSASVKELSVRFAVSEDSIRKDLNALRKKNLIKKTYGGALRLDDDSREHYVSQRKGKYLQDKQKIAKKVLRMLKDGEIIFLDISTTNIEVAKLLKTSGLTLTVVTNMIDVMLAMSGDEYNKLIFVGGTFSEGKDGFVGAVANREIEKYHFDKSFMGVVGVSTELNSVTTYTLDDATTKEQIVKYSKQSYMLLETRKLEKRSGYAYATLKDFAGAITEKPLTDEQRTKLTAYGLECI